MDTSPSGNTTNAKRRSSTVFRVEEGIILIKYFFDSQKVQEERFAARATDPRKHWELSPMDLESWACWWDYTAAYDAMIKATDAENEAHHDPAPDGIGGTRRLGRSARRLRAPRFPERLLEAQARRRRQPRVQV